MKGYDLAGVRFVKASWHPASAPQCAPYQNQILSIDGEAGAVEVTNMVTGEPMTITVKATLRQAIAAGYHHPNAILGGSQNFATLNSDPLAASKGTYRGPAITISTAEGHSVTISPHHPVLTGDGWKAAKFVREGDYLHSASNSDIATRPRRSTNTPRGGAELDHMPTTVEEEFEALSEVLSSVSIPTAGYHFDDDRKFLEGEVHVIVPDDGLPIVPDVQIVEETGEVRFMTPGMESLSESCFGSFDLGRFSIGGAVGGALPDGDTLLLQSPSDGRVGDSHNVADVLAGVPGVVKLDKVIHVEVNPCFVGHAFDFQTVDGLYTIDTLILHNCRHRDVPYTPGTRQWQPPVGWEERNPAQYAALQRQREIERHLRRWKRREEVALTPQAKVQAEARIKHWEAELKKLIRENKHLSRQEWRETTRVGA